MGDLLTYNLLTLLTYLVMLILSCDVEVYSISKVSRLLRWELLLCFFFCFFLFLSSRWFFFFFFFECRIIPIVLIVVSEGSQPERLQAGLQIFIYTFVGCVPILLSVYLIFSRVGTLNMLLLKFIGNQVLNSWFEWACISIGMLVKRPIYLGHNWLPKAHVEASMRGSIMLAGVYLKMGTFGIFRLIISFGSMPLKLSLLIVLVRILGSFVSCLMCVCLSDLKAIIAYSSVSHIGLLTAALLRGTRVGELGCISLILGHGLCSSGLFIIIGFLSKKVNSRRSIICKGRLSLIPIINLVWFTYNCVNLGVPPFVNFLAEIRCYCSIVSRLKIVIPLCFILVVVSGLFRVWLFCMSRHGPVSKLVQGALVFRAREYISCFLRIIFLILIRFMVDIYLV